MRARPAAARTALLLPTSRIRPLRTQTASARGWAGSSVMTWAFTTARSPIHSDGSKATSVARSRLVCAFPTADANRDKDAAFIPTCKNRRRSMAISYGAISPGSRVLRQLLSRQTGHPINYDVAVARRVDGPNDASIACEVIARTDWHVIGRIHGHEARDSPLHDRHRQRLVARETRASQGVVVVAVLHNQPDLDQVLWVRITFIVRFPEQRSIGLHGPVFSDNRSFVRVRHDREDLLGSPLADQKCEPASGSDALGG